jgi:hypothetical protein
VNIEIIGWGLRKPAVVVSHELFGKGVCCPGVLIPPGAAAFDEAILQRQVSPLKRPLAELVLAQIPVMFSSFMARSNCVWPSPPLACLLLLLKTLALSL